MIARSLTALAAGVCLLAACGPTQPPPAPAVAPTPAAHVPAPGLESELQALADGFGGRVGIAVRDVPDGRTVGVRAAEPFPQQSVSKLWVALAAFDAIDRGALRLDEQIFVGPGDLSVFHQPIRVRVGRTGALFTVEELLRGALIQSDNAAVDVLVRRLGGPGPIMGVLAGKRISGIRAGEEERLQQARTAGLVWRADYSYGRSFWADREALPEPVRRAALDRYLADPPDAATPAAIVEALARLQRGELLSAASTDRMLSILEEVVTGPERLKGGLPPGWRLAHKTGTGQVLGPVQTGINDVGLITAPDGRVYAVAVMIAATARAPSERRNLMQAVSRAVVADHERRFGPQIVAPATPPEDEAAGAGLTSPPTPGRTRTAR